MGKSKFLFLLLGVLSLPVWMASSVAYGQMAFNDPGMTSGSGPVGSLVAVETRIEAGQMEPGMNNSVVVQFRNETGGDVEMRDIKLFPSSNVTANIVSNECQEDHVLSAGAQCAVVLDIRGLQSGVFRVEVLARHTGRTRLATATVSGTVLTTDRNVQRGVDIEITPNPIDFGKLEASRSIIRSMIVRNMTSQPITITDIRIDAADNAGFALNTNCGDADLMAGASCVASVVWSPLTKGPTSGALVVQHSGSTGVATAELKGEFLPTETSAARLFPEPVPGKGLLVASEEEIAFGSNVDSHSSITVSLVNIGDAPLTLRDIELAGSEQGLKIINQGCVSGMELQPTEACPLTISWLPSRSGIVIDDVRVAHTGARGVMVLPIRGTSIAAVNIDQKPIMTVIEETYQEPVRSGSDVPTSAPAPQGNTGTPVLDGYTVSSLSRSGAIINGPGGSRMVRNGQTVRLAGHVWQVEITPDGVAMVSGRNRVLMVFDRSLSGEGLMTGGDTGNSSIPTTTGN